MLYCKRVSGYKAWVRVDITAEAWDEATLAKLEVLGSRRARCSAPEVGRGSIYRYIWDLRLEERSTLIYNSNGNGRVRRVLGRGWSRLGKCNKW